MNYNDPIDSKDTNMITLANDRKNYHDTRITKTIIASFDQNKPKTITPWTFKNVKQTIQEAHFINRVFGIREMNGRCKDAPNFITTTCVSTFY